MSRVSFVGCTTLPLFLLVSADGTFKMLMPEMYCRGTAEIFSKSGGRRREGTGAEQLLKETRDGVKQHQN